MTVAELIEQLQQLPPYAPVMAAAAQVSYEVLSVETDRCSCCPATLVRLGYR